MSTTNPSKQTSAILLAAGGVILFSAKAIFIKKAYEYNVDTITLLLLRMLFALPVYLVIASVTLWKQRVNRLPGKRNILLLIAFGISGYYLSSYLDFAGLQYVSASMERLILFAYPAFVVIISALIYKQQIPGKQFVAVLITYFGMFLAFFQSATLSGHPHAVRGIILIICCAFTYACYLMGSQKLIPVFGSLGFTSYAMVIACIAVVIHFLVAQNQSITSFHPNVYWYSFGMAIFSTVLPSFMISEAIRRIGAPGVAIIGSIGPIATIVFASLFLGEHVSAFEGLGTITVISGVLLVNGDDNSKKINRIKNSI